MKKKAKIAISLFVVLALFAILIFTVLRLGDKEYTDSDYLLAKQEAVLVATSLRPSWISAREQGNLPTTENGWDKFDSYVFDNDLIDGMNIGAISSVDEFNSNLVNYFADCIYYKASNGLYVTITYLDNDTQSYVINENTPTTDQGYISWYYNK